MIRFTVLALAAVVSFPAQAAEFSAAAAPAKTLAARMKAVGEGSRDMALAALYQRLFRLQDLKREAELKIDSADLSIEEIYKAYKKLDRLVDSPAELKEIAQDPEHRRYPNMTESSKLKLLGEVLAHAHAQKLSKLDIGRIDRDIAAVERMIQNHLAAKP